MRGEEGHLKRPKKELMKALMLCLREQVANSAPLLMNKEKPLTCF
jgi:hypothetical protein